MARQSARERAATSDVADEEQPLLPINAPQRQKDRIGLKSIGGQFPKPKARDFAILARKLDRTIGSLLGEAIDDVMKKYHDSV